MTIVQAIRNASKNQLGKYQPQHNSAQLLQSPTFSTIIISSCNSAVVAAGAVGRGEGGGGGGCHHDNWLSAAA